MAKLKLTYSEKLKDPRWQKMRLQVLERDEWTCRFCGDKTKTLHVHHFCYAKSGNPWDVEDHALITLCEDCHHLESIKLPEVIQDVLFVVGTAANCTNPDVGEMSHFFRRWIVESIIRHYPKNG